MSSNPACQYLKSSGLIAGIGWALAFAAPLAAQDEAAGQTANTAADEQQEAVPAPAPRPRERLNLSVTVPREESDRLLEEDCEEEADAARIANEIVVCRQLGEASDGSWNKEEWEQDYARRTQGEQPVNTFGIPNHGNPITIGSVPEPVLMIDVEGLPEAPEGSDADRIARGLPPLGEEELSPEEIARRRRALGLEAPELPGS